MPKTSYLTAPVPTDKMPSGIPYIIGNEAAERFCFYGMRTILVVYMTEFLLNRQGNLAVMMDDEAKFCYHLFVAGVYFFPILGAIIADALWENTERSCICRWSIVWEISRWPAIKPVGLFLGLLLITLGAGGIKSCVSANVGDQFGRQNKHLLEKVFGWFYFSINFGSFFSTMLTPVLLDHFSRQDLYGESAKHLGPAIAFGVPGVLMALATLVFWLGRKKFVHIPPGGSDFLREALSAEGLTVIAKLGVLYLLIAMFWALYDQTGAAWVLQAEKMNRTVFYWEIKASQVQAINPLLIMVMIPMFTYGVYPATNKIVRLTPLRKIGIGLFLAVAAFAISGWAEVLIARDLAHKPSVLWQFLAFVIMTAAEVMVSITCLEFSYTQAPRKMKSLIMGLYFLSITLGNAFTAAVNFFIQKPDGSSKLTGPDYYWFFTVLMLVTTLLYCVYAAFYREKTYIQDEGA